MPANSANLMPTVPGTLQHCDVRASKRIFGRGFSSAGADHFARLPAVAGGAVETPAPVAGGSGAGRRAAG
eukprot:1153323-Rhodomonas_salina.1